MTTWSKISLSPLILREGFGCFDGLAVIVRYPTDWISGDECIDNSRSYYDSVTKYKFELQMLIQKIF